VMRIIQTSLKPSRPLLTACAAFGVATHWIPKARGTRRASTTSRSISSRATRSNDDTRNCDQLIAELNATLPAGGVVLITGPSGAGKSTLLRNWQRLLRARQQPAVNLNTHRHASPRDPCVIDALQGPVRRRLSLLAAAGLAEATLLPRRVSELSQGQRFRLRLAAAMQRALRKPGLVTLFIDEFAASLDRTTARSVACTLARWVRRERHVRLVVATAHDDVLEWLRPDALVWVPLNQQRVCRWIGARPAR